MIRRIALTLGMGVAIVAAGSRMAPSQAAAGTTPVLKVAVGVKPLGQLPPRTSHRSGYIVASS